MNSIKSNTMPKSIYQLNSSLIGSDPLIWRKLLVYADTNLIDLHKILQTTMGWTNSHVHLFYDGANDYAPKSIPMEGVKASDTVKLNDLLLNEKDKLEYIYDMGDYWEHKVELKRIMNTSEYKQIPVCIDRKRHCPPEDCGSIDGYEELLEVLKDPEHKEYEEMKEWLGGEFDPEYFSKAEVNKKLKQKNYGCFSLV